MRLWLRLRNGSRSWLEVPRMKLSVIIPAYNERENIEPTVQELRRCLASESVTHEILIINDHSTDGTEAVLVRLCNRFPSIRYLNNPYSPGFGLAVRCGLENFTGDAAALYMADASDRPEDLVAFFRTMMIEGVKPILSQHFNLTVELPLKAIIRGYSYSIVPNQWINRKTGESKLKIKEMGSRYLFIVLYCFIEKWLSRGDYHSRATPFRHSEGTKSIAAGKSNKV